MTLIPYVMIKTTDDYRNDDSIPVTLELKDELGIIDTDKYDKEDYLYSRLLVVSNMDDGYYEEFETIPELKERWYDWWNYRFVYDPDDELDIPWHAHLSWHAHLFIDGEWIKYNFDEEKFIKVIFNGKKKYYVENNIKFAESFENDMERWKIKRIYNDNGEEDDEDEDNDSK